jgi:hypothetical protein
VVVVPLGSVHSPNDIPIKLIVLPNNAEQFLTLFCTPTSQYILGEIFIYI